MRCLLLLCCLTLSLSATAVEAQLVTATPTMIDSGGRTQAHGPSEWGGYLVQSWIWTDDGVGGLFWPSDTCQSPTWIAPGNFSGEPLQRRLGCGWEAGFGGSGGNVLIWELSAVDQVQVTARADSVSVLAGGNTWITATATDSMGHAIAEYAWTDSDAAGNFADPGTRTTRYWPAESGDVVLRVTATCTEGATNFAELTLAVDETPSGATEAFADVAEDQWAYSEIMACVRAGIVRGYDDNTYHPEGYVTRDQLAVYFARAFQLLHPE